MHSSPISRVLCNTRTEIEVIHNFLKFVSVNYNYNSLVEKLTQQIKVLTETQIVMKATNVSNELLENHTHFLMLRCYSFEIKWRRLILY